ncbi:Zinc finger, RING-type [Corchorus capsularis]|uniref:Zinc finger, RING-type n=1 Tax=Corchorus capsularis TaxID=210143 RepID=A0A1R3GDK2_COCAP|nr:Zinc finger, RING-type [Corchorus capsularis]
MSSPMDSIVTRLTAVMYCFMVFLTVVLGMYLDKKVRKRFGLRPIDEPCMPPPINLVSDVVLHPRNPLQNQQQAVISAAEILRGAIFVYNAKCGICSQDFKGKECRLVFKCKHHFHKLCIDQYSLQLCPLCHGDDSIQASSSGSSLHQVVPIPSNIV